MSRRLKHNARKSVPATGRLKLPDLSLAEVLIVRYVCQRFPLPAIARKLDLNIDITNEYYKAIKEKLGTSNKHGVISFAHKLGLINNEKAGYTGSK